eukprot:6447497-Pyramimonas_sp.AAC.2
MPDRARPIRLPLLSGGVATPDVYDPRARLKAAWRRERLLPSPIIDATERQMSVSEWPVGSRSDRPTALCPQPARPVAQQYQQAQQAYVQAQQQGYRQHVPQYQQPQAAPQYSQPAAAPFGMAPTPQTAMYGGAYQQPAAPVHQVKRTNKSGDLLKKCLCVFPLPAGATRTSAAAPGCGAICENLKAAFQL